MGWGRVRKPSLRTGVDAVLLGCRDRQTWPCHFRTTEWVDVSFQAFVIYRFPLHLVFRFLAEYLLKKRMVCSIESSFLDIV